MLRKIVSGVSISGSAKKWICTNLGKSDKIFQI